MAKKVAVLAVNPVNGSGLFQYLEAFYENKIPYKVFAVSDTVNIKTNSGINIKVDELIANLKGKESGFDAVVFSCGDAVPTLSQHMDKTYNQDLFQVLKAFAANGATIIGHCASALIFELAGITSCKKVSVHPMAAPAIKIGLVQTSLCTIDGNFYTARDENAIHTMIDQVVKALQ